MTINEMINSDDKEVAELGCNLFLNDNTIDELKLLLKKNDKWVIANESPITLVKAWLFQNTTMWVKDPTRTLLIDIK